MTFPSLNLGGIYLPFEGASSERRKKIRTTTKRAKLTKDNGIIGIFLFDFLITTTEI